MSESIGEKIVAEVKEKISETQKKPSRIGHGLFVASLWLVGVLVLGSAGTVLASYYYRDRVLPGVHVGNIPLGGMAYDEAKNFLQKMSDKFNSEGMVIRFADSSGERKVLLYPAAMGDASDSVLISFDPADEAGRIVRFGKDQNVFWSGYNLIRSAIKRPNEKINVDYNSVRLEAEMRELLAPSEDPPKDAGVKITSVKPLAYEIVEASSGNVYDLSVVIPQVVESWQNLNSVDIAVARREYTPQVAQTDVEKIISRLPNVLSTSLEISYTEPATKREFRWKLDENKIAEFINVQKTETGDFVFGFKKPELFTYLTDVVSKSINVEPNNAKFEIDESGKVVKFEGSRPGMRLDVEKTYEALNRALIERSWHDEGFAREIVVVTEQVEPAVKMSDVNNLGITEILGVGISDYSNSPSNRIQNIKNAVKKLNGLVVKPGEIFSTLQYTGPFTLENGYLPELVIKGDKMKAEIGGGLCQLGTTLFRMAMNSGLEIVERRNHSLVISHYFDPVNRLPGTDATVYDPAPDFRFRNDTENSILIQTYMDTKTEELVFTVWGTNSDGRSGSYTHPQVLRWIPVASPQEVESDSLAPGERKCQNSFRGADTTFTYTRTFGDGRKEDRVFESHYRALPQICLVGKAVGATCEGESCLVDAGATADTGVVSTPVVDAGAEAIPVE